MTLETYLAADRRGERQNELRMNAEGRGSTATATAIEPRMNADDADRSRPGRGSAHRGRKCCWFLLGARASYAARGARRALAPRPPSGSGARGSPAAAPNTVRPRCREPALPRSDPRVSALIRGSLPLLLPYPRHPRSSAAQLPLPLTRGHPRSSRRQRANPRHTRGRWPRSSPRCRASWWRVRRGHRRPSTIFSCAVRPRAAVLMHMRGGPLRRGYERTQRCRHRREALGT